MRIPKRYNFESVVQCLTDNFTNFTYKQTPGPGTYSVVDSRVFSHKSPVYSLHERCSLLQDNSKKPGPGAHSPEKVSFICYVKQNALLFLEIHFYSMKRTDKHHLTHLASNTPSTLLISWKLPYEFYMGSFQINFLTQ